MAIKKNQQLSSHVEIHEVSAREIFAQTARILSNSDDVISPKRSDEGMKLNDISAGMVVDRHII